MNNWTKLVLALALSLVVEVSNASIINLDLNPDGTASATGAVSGNRGWVDEDTFSGGLNFLVLEINSAVELSIDVVSNISMGISVYLGEIAFPDNIVFSNNGDFFDFNSDLLFIDGIDPFVPGSEPGGSLVTSLTFPGTYTIALGGNEGIFGFDNYDYRATVSVSSTDVSAPHAFFCVCLGLLTLARFRKAK